MGVFCSAWHASPCMHAWLAWDLSGSSALRHSACCWSYPPARRLWHTGPSREAMLTHDPCMMHDACLHGDARDLAWERAVRCSACRLCRLGCRGQTYALSPIIEVICCAGSGTDAEDDICCAGSGTDAEDGTCACGAHAWVEVRRHVPGRWPQGTDCNHDVRATHGWKSRPSSWLDVWRARWIPHVRERAWVGNLKAHGEGLALRISKHSKTTKKTVLRKTFVLVQNVFEPFLVNKFHPQNNVINVTMFRKHSKMFFLAV